MQQGEPRGAGAHCQGLKTWGQWNLIEKSLHINILELKAALLAIKTFTKNKHGVSIHLMIDNMTALAHIAKMGRPTNPALINLAKEIWTYVLDRRMSLTVEYIPSKLNLQADHESRYAQDSFEWKLNTNTFSQITDRWGMPEIDLFASRISFQTPRFYSWKPDPLALATNTLAQSWIGSLLYAFPPFCLIGRCLQKVRRDQSKLTLITPLWTTQPWYNPLLHLVIADPLLIRSNKDILRDASGDTHPLLKNRTLQLVAWLISGCQDTQERYQKRLQPLSSTQKQRAHEIVTNQPGKSLIAGVVQGKLIPFHVL